MVIVLYIFGVYHNNIENNIATRHNSNSYNNKLVKIILSLGVSSVLSGFPEQ